MQSFLALVLSAVWLGGAAQAFPAVSSGLSPSVAPSPLVLKIQAAQNTARMKIVVRQRARRGNAMDIRFTLRIEDVPPGKEYQVLLQDLGMKRDGLPPAPMPNKTHRWVPDQSRQFSFEFALDGFARGEWVQFTLRSTDGTINKTVRFVPFE